MASLWCIDNDWCIVQNHAATILSFLAARTNGRACAIAFRLSVVCDVCIEIVVKWSVLEQKLLLTAYRKSHMRNQFIPK